MFNFFCKKRRLAVFSLTSIYVLQIRTLQELTGGQVLRETYVEQNLIRASMEPNFEKIISGAEM